MATFFLKGSDYLEPKENFGALGAFLFLSQKGFECGSLAGRVPYPSLPNNL